MNKPNVGEVNNHADAVHLVDYTTAKRADATPERLGLANGVLQDRSISKLVVTVMGKGSVAGAEFMELAEVGDGIANLVQALDTERGDELALLESLHGGGTVDFLREVIWVGLLHPRHDVDLIKGELNAWFDMVSTSITQDDDLA